MNIAVLLSEQAKQRPFHKAVVFPAGKDRAGRVLYSHYTFARLEEEANQLAAGLQAKGVEAQTRVLVFIPPSLEFSLVTFALFKLGAVPVFIDPGMGRKNLLRAVRHVRPTVLIGISRALFARRIFRKTFASVVRAFSLREIREEIGDTRLDPISLRSGPVGCPRSLPGKGEAAILFTSGGTGEPKGVIYTHAIFAEQVRMLQGMFDLQAGKDIDLPGFPLFSLFTIAMGVTSVIPSMNPSRPAQADPKKLVQNILDQGVTTANGSPAIWERVADYCLQQQIQLPSLRAMMMFGAPVASSLHAKFKTILPNGDTYTPYGATESLPVTLIAGSEVLRETAAQSALGKGTCVGKTVAPTELKIARKIIDTSGQNSWETLPPFSIGEILVRGKQVTEAYFDKAAATKEAKIYEEDGSFWHRMGDLGYLDEQGRLWFCGRVVHQVQTPQGVLFSVPCEAIFNEHPDVKRSALIRIQGNPCIVVERRDHKTKLTLSEAQRFKQDLLNCAKKHPHTQGIGTFFLHAHFPVDPRHNIKIDRLLLQDLYTKQPGSSL